MSVINAPLNLVTVVGQLCRPPQYRVLKTGDSVVNFDLRVRRDDEPAEIVPVSWFSAPASAMEMNEGDIVTVVGRVRRYWFSGSRSNTDVIADRVVPARSPAKVRRALADAMAALQQVSP